MAFYLSIAFAVLRQISVICHRVISLSVSLQRRYNKTKFVTVSAFRAMEVQFLCLPFSYGDGGLDVV